MLWAWGHRQPVLCSDELDSPSVTLPHAMRRTISICIVSRWVARLQHSHLALDFLFLRRKNNSYFLKLLFSMLYQKQSPKQWHLQWPFRFLKEYDCYLFPECLDNMQTLVFLFPLSSFSKDWWCFLIEQIYSFWPLFL